MTGIVLAQDTGTGLDNQDNADWVDAANLMGVSHSENTTQYKVSGLSVAPDFTNDEVTISEGQARIEALNVSTVDHTGDGTKEIAPYDWDEVTISVVFTASETISIATSGIVEIFIDPKLNATNADQAEIVTTEPSGASLKIAEIDADAETVNENFNVYSDVYHNELTANRISEPDTPSTEEFVRWYDETDEAYKAKFDDGSVITIGEK